MPWYFPEIDVIFTAVNKTGKKMAMFRYIDVWAIPSQLWQMKYPKFQNLEI